MKDGKWNRIDATAAGHPAQSVTSQELMTSAPDSSYRSESQVEDTSYAPQAAQVEAPAGVMSPPPSKTRDSWKGEFKSMFGVSPEEAGVRTPVEAKKYQRANAWKVEFKNQTGIDPETAGISTPEEAEAYIRSELESRQRRAVSKVTRDVFAHTGMLGDDELRRVRPGAFSK